MAEFCMPSLGSDMESGKLVEWRVRPGDRVRRGDIVAVVETQKGAIDVEIFDSGVVDTLVVQPGAEVPVGTVLATVRSEGEAAAKPAAEPAAKPAPPAAEAVVSPAPAVPEAAAPPCPPAPAGETVRASP
ncbi:MAG: biotin/lipoyl-containing protein, partial [Gammaproteobacteria bacterium]